MTDKPTPPNRLRGRPVKLKMPDRIPDNPENVIRALLRTPPKKNDEWEYLKRAKARS